MKIIPDAKVPYPATRPEAVKLIEEIFKADGNKWEDSEQTWFIESLGLKGSWKKFDNEKLKIILEELIRLKMVLIK